MAKLETEIKVTGLQPIEDLIEVLADNYDALPDAVKDALLQIDDDPSVYDSGYLEYAIGKKAYDGRLRVYVDGEITKRVEAGHRIGKRIVYAWHHVDGSSDSTRKPSHTAESFWVTHGNDYICGWGEKPELGGE